MNGMHRDELCTPEMAFHRFNDSLKQFYLIEISFEKFLDISKQKDHVVYVANKNTRYLLIDIDGKLVFAVYSKRSHTLIKAMPIKQLKKYEFFPCPICGGRMAKMNPERSPNIEYQCFKNHE